MHHSERVKSRSQIIHHNARAFGKPLQSPNRKRLPNIEHTKEYKAREKSFPSERDGDEGNQLSRDFIDDDKLRIFYAGAARDQGGGGNSDDGHGSGGDDGGPGAACGWNS